MRSPWIKQVFTNIINNAIKYNDKSTCLINIGCVEQKGFFEFYIKDNGPGIEKKDFMKIFQIFRTLGIKPTEHSTGIGLAFVKKIIERNGGQIRVLSEIGKGSIFYFTVKTVM